MWIFIYNFKNNKAETTTSNVQTNEQTCRSWGQKGHMTERKRLCIKNPYNAQTNEQTCRSCGLADHKSEKHHLCPNNPVIIN